MKAKKLVGAIALTAALAMGTMPAFATTSNWYDAGGDFANGVAVGTADTSTTNNMATVNNSGSTKQATGSTKVYASVYDADINVTVPVAMAVAFANNGVSDIKTPTNYTVVNNSPDHAVKLVSVTGTAGALSLTPTAPGTSTASTNNELYIPMAGFADALKNGTAVTPSSEIKLNTANPDYTFDFSGAKAHIGSPLSVGYQTSAVCSLAILFEQAA